MRDEDLKNLPQSVERWRFAELMHSLGFGEGFQNNLRDFSVDWEGISAVVYATDAEGRKYLSAPESSDVRVAATHEISIPFVGRWEKPSEVTQACGSSSPEGDATCELPEAHYFCRSGDGSSWPYPGSRPPCPAYLTLGPDLRSNCERAEGHPDEHVSRVGGVLQRW